MKPLLAIVIAFLLFSFVPVGRTDRGKAGLFGKVKSVENWIPADEKSDSKSLLGRDSSRSLIIYGIDGQVIEAVYLDRDSMQRVRDDYKYDNDGRLDEITLDAMNHSDFPIKVEFRYNKNGQLREIDRYNGTGSSPANESWYDYDDNGWISTTYKQSVGMHYNEVIEYKRDKEGRVIQVDKEDGNNQLREREVYAYDTAGQLAQYLIYNSSDLDKYETKEAYTYNADGKKIEQWNYYTIFRKHTADSIRYVWEYYYNDAVVEKTEYDYPSGNTKSTRDSVAYEYDSIGNWVKQSHYYDNEKPKTLYRKINYY